MQALATMGSWPRVDYAGWSATCDTLHAHTQVLGKLAVELAAPEPQLQHTALRVTARGWETYALPAPNGSGLITAALDLRTHDAIVEHSGGREARIPLSPDRAVAERGVEDVGRLRRSFGRRQRQGDRLTLPGWLADALRAGASAVVPATAGPETLGLILQEVVSERSDSHPTHMAA